MKKTFVVVLLIVCAFLLVLAACAKQTPVAVTSSPANTDGATLLQDRCSTCHSLDRVTQKSDTLAGWQSMVSRMVDKGAQLSAEEQAVLAQYLADTYK